MPDVFTELKLLYLTWLVDGHNSSKSIIFRLVLGSQNLFLYCVGHFCDIEMVSNNFCNLVGNVQS